MAGRLSPCERGELGENVGMTATLRIRPFIGDLGSVLDACLHADALRDAS
jgi:hypothetical protein